jgi:hypothetical protein
MRTFAVMFAAALVVAGCGGAGAKPIGASNNTSVCAHTKRVGRGRVYVEIAVSPVSLEQTACSAFNRSFDGRSFGGRPPILSPARAARTAVSAREGRRTGSRSACSRHPTRERDARSAARSTPVTASDGTF